MAADTGVANKDVSEATGSAVGLAAYRKALLADYGTASGFDEMMAADGSVRPHWRGFIDGLAALGPDGIGQASESTLQSLRASGIAFNVWADPDDPAHRWRLDLLPLVIHSDDFESLASGLVQRARLFDLVLRDCYGERRLVREGLLPPALILGSNRFVRPEVGMPAAPAMPFGTFACDVARDRHGRWVVLSDQADCSVGNGYVLASRVALSHGLADLFLSERTRRLSGYYARLQDQFANLAGRDDGRVVVLSSGPEDPSYFSHAYMSRYMGYPLCEAGDLTVRDGLVHLKTLDGLQRVDIIIRKISGHDADPLFLPGTGVVGVPGLVEVIRAGRVRMVNQLGSGVLQHRALAPFSRQLMRELLGEIPILHDAECVWLGAEGAIEQARAESMTVMRATARNDPGAPLEAFGPERHAEIFERIGFEKHLWIAQQPVTLATTPAWVSDSAGGIGRLARVPFAIRCYVARAGDDWMVLPGGMVRLAGTDSAPALPNGFGSKDLWVTQAGKAQPPPSLLSAAMREVHLRRVGRDLLSRSGDNLYWLGRYVERADGMMRLLRSAIIRLIEDGATDRDVSVLVEPVRALVAKGETEPGKTAAADFDLEASLRDLVFTRRRFGLPETLADVRRTATLVRDQISNDAWRFLNSFHVDRRWSPTPGGKAPGRIGRLTVERMDEGLRILSAFAGTAAENMTRNFAWRLLEAGRRIERASMIVDMVKVLVAQPDPIARPEIRLRLLLELCDSAMTYRSRYLMTPLAAPVLDLLLLDETNPRSLAFQCRELDWHLSVLAGDAAYRDPLKKIAFRALAGLRLAEVTDLAATASQDGTDGALAILLHRLETDLPALSDLIVATYFAHAEQQVTTIGTRRIGFP